MVCVKAPGLSTAVAMSGFSSVLVPKESISNADTREFQCCTNYLYVVFQSGVVSTAIHRTLGYDIHP